MPRRASLPNLLMTLSLMALSVTTGVNAQDFIWIEGSAASTQSAIFGTQGVAADSNTPGGRRRGSAWRTDDARVWVFGGDRVGGSGGNLGNDLWVYDPATSRWTWVKGSVGADASGVYGTRGTGTASTTPGSRRYSAQFLGADDRLWLFGGERGSSLFLNDLWSYDPATNIWTWEAGASVSNQTGIYATGGPNDPRPGGRVRPGSGTDASGRLILFGGSGFGTTSSTGDLSDLWRFDPETSVWTLLWGSGTLDRTGTYGTVKQPGGSPGGRSGCALWVDAQGRIHVFGGTGRASTGASGLLNDLWRFDPTTSEWTWLGGSTTINGNATYGTLRVASADNWPGARRTPTWSTDTEGHFMLFGGFGYSPFGMGGLADFWRYDPASGHWTWTALVREVNLPDVRGTKGIGSPANRVEAKSDAFSVASNPSRDFHIYGSIYGTDGEDVLWRFRLPNLRVDSFSLADLDQANNPDPGFTNDPVVAVSIAADREFATYARLGRNFALTNDEILPLDMEPMTFALTGADGIKTVQGRVGDAEGESYSVATTITLDTMPPAVAVLPVATRDPSPEVSGTIIEVNLRDIAVEIDGTVYLPAVGEGTWSLPAGSIAPSLAPGKYDVVVTAGDRAGNVTVETATEALVIREPITSDVWLME